MRKTMLTDKFFADLEEVLDIYCTQNQKLLIFMAMRYRQVDQREVKTKKVLEQLEKGWEDNDKKYKFDF